MSDIAIDFLFGFSRAQCMYTQCFILCLIVLEAVRLPFVDAFRSYPSTLYIIARFSFRTSAVEFYMAQKMLFVLRQTTSKNYNICLLL